MCVDRLEVNLKPACVSACLGNALDFGVVDDLPDNREQGKTSIPGFPDPQITQPNIRFQQIKNMPDEVTRTDGMSVKYHKGDDGQYRPVVDQKKGIEKKWSLAKLSSRENPLVIFTLVSQVSLGAFYIAFLGAQFSIQSVLALRDSVMYIPLMAITVGLAGLGMLVSATHLGKPWRFYRGFNNLRHSPVCREGLGMLLYMVFAGIHLLLMLPANDIFINVLGDWGRFDATASVSGYLALIAGSVGLYYMYRCYRIPARPFWNHWQTATSFLGTAITLGSILLGLVGIPTLMVLGGDINQLFIIVLGGIVIASLMEGLGLWRHAIAMDAANNEGSVSHYIQCTVFGKSYVLRNGLIAANVSTALLLIFLAPSAITLGLALMVCLSVLLTAIISRTLFYVLVIPTTMPGAFFWKNKDFEEHARDIGLANMPQVGVVAHGH
jgi:DMSO reductase anchor subunit